MCRTAQNIVIIIGFIGLGFAAPSRAAESAATRQPHFVKSLIFDEHSGELITRRALEHAQEWTGKRSGNVWVRLESYYCNRDMTKRDEPIADILPRALVRAETIKKSLINRGIAESAIEIAQLGREPGDERCLVRLLAGTTR